MLDEDVLSLLASVDNDHELTVSFGRYFAMVLEHEPTRADLSNANVIFANDEVQLDVGGITVFPATSHGD